MNRQDTVVGENPTQVRARATLRGPAVPPPPPRAPAKPREVPGLGPLPTPPRPAFLDPSHLTTSVNTPRPVLELVAPTPTPITTPTAQGKVLVFFGCRGGAGATTLSVNVASSLARSGLAVCVLDLDLQLGDVFVALDLEPVTSIAGLAREAGTIDGPALRRRLARHDSGIYALGQTGRLDDIDAQLPDRMPALLASLCDHFDVVVVDGVRDFSDHALAALDMADRVALVVTQDVPAVRRAARVTQLFRKLGYSDRKIQLVVNRHLPKAALGEDEIERALAMPIAGVVRNDYIRMRSAMDDGALLHDVARTTGIANDIDELSRTLAADQAKIAATPELRPGLLSRILSGRSR